MLATGRLRPALEKAVPLAAQARELGFAPLIAQVLSTTASLQIESADLPAATKTLQAALVAAESASDQRTRAELRLVASKAAERAGDLEGFQRELDLASAILERLPRPDALRAELAFQQATLAYFRGDTRTALDRLRQSVASYERAQGRESPGALAARKGLATTLMDLGDFGPAGQELKTVLELETRLLGPEHPAVAGTLVLLGAYELMGRGDYSAALADFERAVALREQSFGADNPRVADALNTAGEALRQLGRLDEAEARYVRAEALVSKALGPEHPDLPRFWNNLAANRRAQRRFPEALELHRKALAAWEKQLGSDHPLLAMVNYELAETLREANELPEAMATYERALAVQRKARAPGHPDEAFILTGLGRAKLAAGERDGAREALQTALRIRQNLVIDPLELARTHLALSRVAAPADARPLAESALRELEGAPPSPARDTLRLDARAWIRPAPCDLGTAALTGRPLRR
ncbi:MAG: tetratricopeptide repeat protein [Myxococcales bacterium]